ncbi:unnamed protein product [Eruca vesicaria subsp. sativa]|uniref:Alpha/beta hydrolase fold-3 domain-containing protein n=1 Tax=Eruca vesicaria subsp. sativa TaxID=29727 RepID=A0ABC8KT61_ERUVS|nr:unnamed protein product [Eruca vesicaria subsp. sativa]
MSGSSQASPNPFPPPQVESKDIIVDHSKSSRMRLYVPTTALNGGVASKKLPLVVYFHAGVFTSRNVFESEIFTLVVGGIACEINVVVAAASYRLAPENKLPAAYEDGVDAVEWLRNNSEEDEWLKSYADLSNVFLMGTGTGGNVAYNVGLRFAEEVLTPLSIRGLILESPLFSGEELFPSERGHLLTLTDVSVLDSYWMLCLPDGADRDHEYSNPTVGAGPDNMEKIVRSGWKVMVRGGGDTLREVARLMKKKGVDVMGRLNSEDQDASVRSFIYSSAP